MNDEIKIIADQLMQSGMEMDSAIDEAIRLSRQSAEEDLRLQDLEDQVMGRSRPYKRGERMLRLLDPSQDPLTGERNIRDFGRQKIANIIPGMTLIGREKVFQGHNPLYNLLQEANRVSKAYHGQDYLKELHHRVMQAGRGRVDKDFGYESSFADGGQVFASDTDKIAQKLIEQGLDRETAMAAALRMAQSRQQADQSILGGVPTQPPTSDVPPATEILGGDPSRLFQRQPTAMERIRDLPKDVLGAGEALVSMGSLAALAPASMLYALRPGQKTQGDPMEFALRNMYMPRSERGPSHLAGLGEVLESLPQTGPLPELQAFTGVGRGVGRQLAQKARQAGEAMAPKAADIAENILSRQGLLMQAAPSGPTKVEAPASPLGFYDPVHQAALNIQRKQGPGQAFLNELQRSENVNKEFLEASGLAEKLRTTPNITREEVQSLAKGAVPEIQEVVKGGKEVEVAKRAEANLNQSWRELENSLPDMPMLKFYNLRDMWADAAVRGDQNALQNIKALELTQDVEDAVFAYGRAKNEYAKAKQFSRENPPKYANYQLPGGENYREVLLTIPSKQERDFAWEWFDPATQQSKQFATRDAALLDKPLGAIVQKVETAERNKDYKSAHWEEPNVVSHIRMNDRTDADGKKVLFIEEIQSDWAQEGRKKGFQTNDLKIDGKTAEEWQNEAVRLFESMPDVPSPEQTSAMNAASRNARELRDRARSQGLKDGQQVPVAPFVQNTKEWVDLSLKNIIKRAVDEGYDRVAFINGTQSADRYKLSKQIEQLKYSRNPETGKYKISFKPINDEHFFVAGEYDAEKLSDAVGKEVAEKIVGEANKVSQGKQGVKAEGYLSNLDLQIGGEGMKAFYDKLVPERVNAILKRFGGGKTTPVQFQVAPASSLYPDKTSLRETVTQPGFDITPAMRERFQKPIPYKQGGSVNHKAVASARRALEKAMAKGGQVKMAGGGSVIGKAAAAAAKQAKAVLSPAESQANLQKMLAESQIKERLYHGTTATEGGKGQEAIRRIKPSKEGSLGAGVYLTPQSEFASTYAGFPARSQLERDIETGSDFAKRSARQLLDRMERGAVEPHEVGGNILPVYAQIKKPLIIEGKGDPMIEALIKLGMDEDKASRMVERAYENKGYIGKEVQLRALSQGYDGLMQYRNGDLAEVVVYNPNAIKSAIGNQGTYDITSPELSKAHGGEVKMGTGGSMLGTVAGRAAAAGKKSTQWAQEAAAAKRAPAKSKEEIEAIARRMAAQAQPGFVRASEEQSINPAGKSQLLYEMEQRTPMVVESTIADRPVPNVDYEQQLGKVIVGVPGDPTMGQVAVAGSLETPTRGGKQLVQVGDVRPETPVQLYGGPRYGANLDETFWASNLSPARAVQNLVQEMAQKYGAEQVLGKYIKMSPESSRFAMHNLDALISVLQPEKLDKDKVELLNNLVRKGNPKHKFPEFAGFEDPINVLLQAQMNSKLRKQISEVLEKPSVAKQVGFPFPGKVVQTAITEPELRNVETGVTGFAIGKMNPKGKLSFSSHPTYDYDIPGQAIGRSKYLVPSELSFPDFMAWYRSRPDVQAKVDPINMMKSYGPRQVIDQQYIDEIKMYEEAMKRLTGKKKGGLMKKSSKLPKVIKSGKVGGLSALRK